MKSRNPVILSLLRIHSSTTAWEVVELKLYKPRVILFEQRIDRYSNVPEKSDEFNVL
jgi:hypothetical protein